MGLAHEKQGQLSQAIGELKRAASVSDAPLYVALLGHAYAVAGDRPKAFAILHDLDELSKHKYVSPIDMAVVYTGLGDKSSAFAWLERGYSERTTRILELPDPIFDALRDDSRFADLTSRVGLPLRSAAQRKQ